MSNLIQINSFANKFSPNLLGIGSSFTDINQIYNITSGTGTLQFGTAKEYGYFADVSNNSFTTTDFVFNFGNTLKSNIYYSDNYIFQMSLIDFVSGTNSFLPFDFEVLIYKDGVNTDTLLLNFDLNSVVFDGKVATFSQSIFISGTVNVVDFAFKIIHNPSALNSNLDFRFGNLKLERDDKFLGLPTPYSLPIDYCCSDTKGYVQRSQLGWASYIDTLHTSGAPQLITEGVTPVLLTNNCGTVNSTQLPDGVVKLFDQATTKITPVQENDFNSVDIMFTVKNSVTNGFFTVYVDIPTLGHRFEQLFVCPKTAGTAMGVNYSFHHFVSEQFATNGGIIYIVANSGNLQIYDKQYRFAKLINAK